MKKEQEFQWRRNGVVMERERKGGSESPFGKIIETPSAL